MKENYHFTSEELVERLLWPVRRSLHEAMGIMARGLDYHRMENKVEPVENPPVPWAGAKSFKALEGEWAAGDHPSTHRILAPTDLRSGKSPIFRKEIRPDSAAPLKSGQMNRREGFDPSREPPLHLETAKPETTKKPETGNSRRPLENSSRFALDEKRPGATPALGHTPDPDSGDGPIKNEISQPETWLSPGRGPDDPGGVPFSSRQKPAGDRAGTRKFVQSATLRPAGSLAPTVIKDRSPVESEKPRFASGSPAKPPPEPASLHPPPFSKSAAPGDLPPPPQSPIRTDHHPGPEPAKKVGSSANGEGAAQNRSGTDRFQPAATAPHRIDDPSRFAAPSIPGGSKPPSPRPAGYVPLAKPLNAAVRRAAGGVEPVLEQAYAVTRQSFGTEPEPGVPKTDAGGIERVSNTFNVNVALSADSGLKTNQRQALEEALVDILRTAARRQGLEL